MQTLTTNNISLTHTHKKKFSWNIRFNCHFLLTNKYTATTQKKKKKKNKPISLVFSFFFFIEIFQWLFYVCVCFFSLFENDWLPFLRFVFFVWFGLFLLAKISLRNEMHSKIINTFWFILDILLKLKCLNLMITLCQAQKWLIWFQIHCSFKHSHQSPKIINFKQTLKPQISNTISIKSVDELISWNAQK